MLHRDLTEKIIRGFYQTYNAVGPGYPEAVYLRVLRIVLKSMGLIVDVEVPIHLFFRGHDVGEHRLDMVVQLAVIVEGKAVSQIHPAHRAQTRSYLTATGLEVGLLLNFGPKPEFERFHVSNATRFTREIEFRAIRKT